MASSPVIQDQADADPALTLVATTGPWALRSTRVRPSSRRGRSTSSTTRRWWRRSPSTPTSSPAWAPRRATWLPVAQRWYADPVVVVPADRGRGTGLVDEGAGRGGPRRHPLPAGVTVSDIQHHRRPGAASTSSRVGVPVLVRVSYFPAWHATGALGPWRAEPNLMVVVPTLARRHAHLRVERAGKLGVILSLVGHRGRWACSIWRALRLPLTRRSAPPDPTSSTRVRAPQRRSGPAGSAPAHASLTIP